MIVLRVNGEPIEESALQLEAAAVLRLMNERMEEEEDPQVRKARAREWAEENLIEAALMRQAAAAEPKTDAAGDIEPNIRLERLMTRVTENVAPPRRKDVVAYYMKNRESFAGPETIRVAHIVRNVDEQNSEESARAAIDKAQGELVKGRAFAEVADELSDCPGKGGDLGFFARGDMVPEFEEVVFGMKIDEVSPIFRTGFGFHIAKMLGRAAAGPRQLEDVQEQIEEFLLQEKKQKKLHQFVDSLRARATIEREAAR